MSDLVKRLRDDGDSWAQPLFNEAANRIEEIEQQLAKAQTALNAVEKRLSDIALMRSKSPLVDAAEGLAAIQAFRREH